MATVSIEPLHRSLIDAAARAFSPHNAQAWQFHLDRGPEGDRIFARLDPSRLSYAADPLHRGGWASLGSALENARITAHSVGVPAILEFTEAEEWPVALTLRQGPVTPSRELALASQIYERRSYRGRMVGPALTPQVLAEASRLALPGARLRSVTHRERVPLLELLEWSIGEMLTDRARRRDLHRWYRVRPWQSGAGDGLPVANLGLRGMRRVLAPVVLGPPFDGWFKIPRRLAHEARVITDTSPDVFLVTSPTDDPTGWFAAGAGLQRALLSFTASGAATHALNGPLEIPAAAAALRRLFGMADADGLVALLRAGRAPATVPPSPARPAESFLV